MKRKIIVIASAAVAVLTILYVVLVIAPFQPGRQVFFSRPESKIVDAGPARMQRISFTVTNTANRAAILQVAAVETRSTGGWTTDTDALAANSFRTLAKVKANQTVFLSVEFPQTSFTRRLKVLVSEEATQFQKAQFALRRIDANLRHNANYKQLWFTNIACPSYEMVTAEIP